MSEVKVGLRYNATNDEVELTVDGEVALTSGKEVFESWVRAYNDKYQVLAQPQEPVQPVVVETATVEPEQKVIETPVEEKVVDPAEPVPAAEPQEVAEVPVETVDNEKED
jgi:hypothetical protein